VDRRAVHSKIATRETGGKIKCARVRTGTAQCERKEKEDAFHDSSE
jgi:hypothetical protein